MTNAEIIARAEKVLVQNYKPAPIAIVRGEGSYAWDADGKRYLDLICGIATCALGHCHPAVREALEKQARTLWHASNLFHTLPQVELAERLTASAFGGRAFFCNSGAEANETMIKLARKYMRETGRPERYEILCAEDSFHGRTMGALAATGQPKYHKGFEPMLEGFRHVPYGDAAAMEKAIGPKTAAILIEPVQGEAGVRVPPAGYLAALREICDRQKILLLLDEVQTGMGRTGKMWAHQHAGIAPDAMSTAKALGNGAPMGAMLATHEVARVLVPGTHASTFGGNPLAASAACAVYDTLAGGALEHGRRQGEWLMTELREKLAGKVRDVRGMGMLIAVELHDDTAQKRRDALRESGVLVNAIGDKVIRLAPSLLLSDAERGEAVSALVRALGV